MGTFTGTTDTQFIGAGELGAVTSYQPCHLFGDSNLIGIGIRLGFYLLYLAAIIAVLTGVDAQFRFWHGSWTVVGIATFISLAVNATGDTLVIIDWAILIQLVLWYPIFFVFTILHRHALHVSPTSNPTTLEAIQHRLQQVRKRAVTHLEAARARTYADALKAFALHAAAEHAEDARETAQADLIASLQTLTEHWETHRERIATEVIPGRVYERVEENETVSGTVLRSFYSPAAIAEIAAAPTRADVLALRDQYVAALMRTQIDREEALEAEHELALLAAEELRLKRRARKPGKAIEHLLIGASWKDRLAAALGLLTWSAYMLATPALYWTLLDNGRKTQCDADVKLLFVLAPKQPFVDAGFKTFLKVWTVGVVIVAIFTSVISLYLLFGGLLGRGSRNWVVVRTRGGKRGKGEKGNVEEGRRHHHGVVLDDVTRSREFSNRTRAQNSEEILDSLHHAETRDVHHRFRKRVKSPMHFSLTNIPWTVTLAILWIETIATVERTITIDNLDFVRPQMHDTAELLAFFVGLFALVLTILSVSGALWSTCIRKRHAKVQGGKQKE